MTTAASEEQYQALNDGCDDDAMSPEYQAFVQRIANLWMAGYEKRQSSRILPTQPIEYDMSSTDLRFVLVDEYGREAEFYGFVMTSPARAAHHNLFKKLYFERLADDETTDAAAYAALGLSFKSGEARGVTPATPGGQSPAPAPPSAPVKSKRKKQKRESDMFDPLAGLLY